MPQKFDFQEIFPLSANRPADTRRLLDLVARYLPQQEWFYDADTLTDRNERFLVTETLREKLFRLTGDELPYSATVVIDRWEEEAERLRIAATFIVEREAHKGMVIGKGGERLKRIGSEARQDLQRQLDRRIHLELWVKVRSGWADSEEHVRAYGYD